ncbi:hypothetical protein, partial [Roseimaritima sediminicola]|uniref:hypothetical protein n=1 Tax=Roseimaritima sediminicola TaxID=2662066 RepID=UPI001F2BF209
MNERPTFWEARVHLLSCLCGSLQRLAAIAGIAMLFSFGPCVYASDLGRLMKAWEKRPESYRTLEVRWRCSRIVLQESGGQLRFPVAGRLCLDNTARLRFEIDNIPSDGSGSIDDALGVIRSFAVFDGEKTVSMVPHASTSANVATVASKEIRGLNDVSNDVRLLPFRLA